MRSVGLVVEYSAKYFIRNRVPGQAGERATEGWPEG